ncbi:MAG: DUF4350 domain-containing protein [Candidatus Thorarchaeota archaeon]
MSQFLIFGNGFTITSTHAIPTKKVLFDESHFPSAAINASNPCVNYNGYEFFEEMLVNNDYEYDTLDVGQNITQANLDGYNILVISGSQINYTYEECIQISNWIEDGGSLLLITDWNSFGTGTYDLLSWFGFGIPAVDGIRESDDLAGNYLQIYLDDANILNHTITEGVSRVEVYATTGLIETNADSTNILVTDNDDTATWDSSSESANNIPLMCALEGNSLENGKLVIMTDFNLWLNTDSDLDGTVNFYDSDNEILALNTINWLNVPYTKTTPIQAIYPIAFLTFGIVLVLRKKKN